MRLNLTPVAAAVKLLAYEMAFKSRVDAQQAAYNKLAQLSGQPLRKLPDQD